MCLSSANSGACRRTILFFDKHVSKNRYGFVGRLGPFGQDCADPMPLNRESGELFCAFMQFFLLKSLGL
jgi:hypothetical protein